MFTLTTYTPHGQVYKVRKNIKTKAGLRRSKERLNLEYGCHLRGEAKNEKTGEIIPVHA